MRPGKQGERVTRDKRYLEIAVAGCLEIYSCAIEGRGIDRSRRLPQTIDGRPERTSFTIHTGPYTPQYQTSGVSIFHLPKEGGETSHLRIAEAATQPGRFPSDLVRTESNFFLSSSHRVTPEPDVCLLSHPRSLPWHRLATGPRCHSHSRRMCTTKSRPPASAVSPKPVYFCVGGTTASSEAGHIFQRRNLASFPWRWPPRRVSVVPFQGSHLTLPIHSPSQDEKFLPAQEPFPPHPPYRNKTNPLPSRYTNPPNMQGTRQPAPPPPTISITGRYRPILLTTHHSIKPGEFGSRPRFGVPSGLVYT